MLSKTQTSLFLSDPDEIEDRARLYAFMYIMLGGVAFLSSLGMYYGVVAAGEHVAMEMRSALFESFFHHSVGFFDQPQHSVGTLTARLAGETRFVSKALGEGFARQLQAISTLLVALGLGFSSSWQIAFIVIACFPLTIAAGAVRMKAMRGMQYVVSPYLHVILNTHAFYILGMTTKMMNKRLRQSMRNNMPEKEKKAPNKTLITPFHAPKNQKRAASKTLKHRVRIKAQSWQAATVLF